MQYQFDIEIARRFGVDEAIFVHNLYFWILKNEANDRHQHDGKTWTYNSNKALARIFPFWSPRQVERVVNSCREKGLVETMTLSENKRDRTLWYTVTQTVKCIYANGEMDITESGNPFTETVECIKGTDSKPDSKPDREHAAAADVVDLYNSVCTGLSRCIKVTEKRKQSIKALLKKGYTVDDITQCFVKAQASAFFKGKGGRGWRADFDWLMDETHLVNVLEGRYDMIAQMDEPPRGGLIEEGWASDGY